MADPYLVKLQEAVDKAGSASSLDDEAGVALAGSFYKNHKTGKLVATYGAGWETLVTVSVPGGYDGTALYHPSSRGLVIINRGTEGFTSWPDWRQNIGSALFDNPGPQLRSAMDILLDGFDKAKGRGVDHIFICGHSLGGALADAQGAFVDSLLASKGMACPPVKVVGVASAGFADAARVLAGPMGLTVSPSAKTRITHYVRRKDFVPGHPGRETFGTDRVIASIWHARQDLTSGPHATGHVPWVTAWDITEQHRCPLYLAFMNAADTGHIWRNRKGKYDTRDGAQPSWERSFVLHD